MQMNLASLKSVKQFAEKVLKDFPQIHALINCAGVKVPVKKNMKTEDGFEIHFGVNHLSHFLLTTLLLERLKKSAPSRIVIVASTLHEIGVIDFDNLNGEKGFGDRTKNSGYCNSKLANLYMCDELARRTVGSGVDVVGVCPGIFCTDLYRYTVVNWLHKVIFWPTAFLFWRTAAQGSQTILHCAVSDSIQGTSGQLYRDCKPWKSTHDFKPDVLVM